VAKRVDNKQTAEDLTSDIFEKVLKSLNDFQWQGITVSAWIFRVARNHIIDYYRKNSKRRTDRSLEDMVNKVVSPSPDVETELESRESEIELYKAIKELRPEEQYLIYYKFFEEMSNKRIARLTGLTETNIGTKLHRVRKKLEKLLKDKAIS